MVDYLFKISGCGIESTYSQLNFRYRACFEQGFPCYSGNYRVLIQSKCVCDMIKTHT